MQLGNCCTSSGDGRSRRAEDDFGSELAAQFAALSVQEREAIIEEIHGVVPEPHETKEGLDKLLQEMRRELQNIPSSEKRAFTKVVFLRPALETDDKFMLRFLRAERYDPKEAAIKVCVHFKHKLELFPLEMLSRRITIDDLSEDDIEVMKTCNVHPLSTRDQTGRLVLLAQLSKMKFKHWKNQVSQNKLSLHKHTLQTLPNESESYGICTTR